MADENEEKKPEDSPAEKQEDADKEDKKAQNNIDRGEDMIDKANEAAERLEKANQQNLENLERQERLKVEKTLGGKSEAGAEKKEETPEEYKNRIMEGSDEPN